MRWPAHGGHPPPRSPAQARCLEGDKWRPAAHPRAGPARFIQITIAAPGRPGSGCTPAPGGCRISPARRSSAQGGVPAQAGPVESRPPHHTAGCLPQRHRQGTGYFQKHGQKVRRPTGCARQPDSKHGPTTWPLRTIPADIFPGHRHNWLGEALSYSLHRKEFQLG